jgi:WD40 repeat protein
MLTTLMFSLVWLALLGVIWLGVEAVAWLGYLVGRLLFIGVFWKVLSIAMVWLGLVVGASFLFSESVSFEANAINHLWSVKRSEFILSPDGATTASLSNDHKTITLYDQNTGKKRACLEVDDFEYLSVVFSRIVKFLASQGKRDLDVNHGFLSVAFSPDGKFLATGSMHDIRIWDVATGTKKGSLVGQNGEILSLAFSPDGKSLASGSFYGSVWLWDVVAGKRRILEEPWWLDNYSEDSPYYVAFSPDGKTLAALVDEGVGLWDVESGKHTSTLSQGLGSVTFTPDGTLVALRDNGEKLKVWEVASVRVKLVAVLCTLTLALLCLLAKASMRRLQRVRIRSGSNGVHF